MFRHVLLTVLLGVLLRSEGHAQAPVHRPPPARADTLVQRQEPSLREALHQVATGKGSHKGRLLGRWAAHKAGRYLHISIR